MKYIGVFDSGVGGLTVTESINAKAPHENVVFIADIKNNPYGSKPVEEIKKCVLSIFDKLKTFDLKALAFGCNTADSLFGDYIEKKLDIPVIRIVEPTCKKAALTTKNNKIGVLATEAAVKAGKFIEYINKYNEDAEVICIACPKLVPLAEKGITSIDNEELKEALEEYLNDLKDVDTLILGCTHYPYFEKAIKTILKDVNIISSSNVVAEELVNKINLEKDGGETLYYATADKERLENIGKLLIKKDIKANLI